MAAFRYRPEVDGLRAVSVLAVIAFHAGFGCPGGYVGVDVFFVISGYLITSLIQKDLSAGTFSLADFWVRRFRRIIPAVSLMVLGVLAAGNFVLLPDDFKSLGSSALAQTLFVSNMYFWKNTGYFARAAETEPLLHTWSLAVEEQFYLGFPLLMWVLRRGSRARVIAVLSLIAGLSFAASVYGAYRHPVATFFLLPTRAWELLAGSLVALVQPAGDPVRQSTRPRWSAELASWIGAGLILTAIFGFDNDTVFPGAAAVVPVMGAALYIAANTNQLTSLGRGLALRPLVFIGLLSYSLYLWHWPVIVFVRYIHDEVEPSRSSMAGTLLISFCLAVLAWRFVEEPIRRKRILAGTPRLIAATTACLATLLVVAGCVVHFKGLPDRLPGDWKIFNAYPRAHISDYRSGHPPLLGTQAASDRPVFLVWGDSHAGVMLPAFDEAAREFGVSGVTASRGGLAPIPGVSISWAPELREWNARVLEFIKSRRIPHVFLAARWSQFIEGSSPYDISIGQSPSLPLISCDNPAGRSVPMDGKAADCFRTRLTQLIQELRATDCTVWIMTQVPDQPYNVLRRRFLENNGIPVIAGPTLSIEDFQQRQRRVDDVFESLVGDRVHVISVHEKLFDATGRAITIDNGVPLYLDSNHLSVNGVEQIVRPIVMQVMAAAAREESERSSRGDASPSSD